MCGRYMITTKSPMLREIYGLDEVEDVRPRYNVAPTDPVPAVRVEDGRRVLQLLRWGLLPFWSKSLSDGARMINARSETLFEKPAFRDALKKRRCLVIANGFYEWKREGEGKKAKKTPYLFAYDDGRPLAFAGLWARWKGPAGPVDSCTILTTSPNALMAPFHDRMPVILDPADQAAWLDPQRDEVELDRLSAPRELPGFGRRPVDPRVGNVKNDFPELLETPQEESAAPPATTT